MIEPGTLLDERYRLEERIGEGGAGEVWRARHVTLDSVVAIKVLHVGTSNKESARKRFLQEARVTAQLRIRQAVQVHDFGFVGERPYLVMELLHGETLKQRLARQRRLSVRQTVTILRQAARALDRAHALGIIHRDFKPDNVFLLKDEDGEEDVRVVDFGIAKLVGGFEDEEEPPASGIEAASVRSVLLGFTRTGGVLGTPYYMAPEQVQTAMDLGPQADVWAFGVVAYECLTGHRPFEGTNAGLLFKAILDAEHVPAERHVSSLPTSFSAWFRKACAPDPKDRFADARTAVAELEEALGVLPIVGPSWLEGTDASLSIQTGRQSSHGSQSSAQAASSTSLSGTARAVRKAEASRRLALVAIAGVLLLALAVGLVAGRRGADGADSEANATAVPSGPPPGTIPATGGSAQGVGEMPLDSARVRRPDAGVEGTKPGDGSSEPQEPAGASGTVRPLRAVPTRPLARAIASAPLEPELEPELERDPRPPASEPPSPSKPPSPLELPPLGI